VILLVRKEHMRASHAMRQHLEAAPNITVRYNIELERITGDEHGVKAVEIRNNKTNELSVLTCDGVFIAIGHDPNSALVDGKVDLLPSKHIVCSHGTRQTSVPGIFAAGDVEDYRYRQAGSAAGRGIDAAIDADRYLREIGSTQEFRQQLMKRSGYFENFSHAKVDIQELANIADLQEKTATGLVLVDFFSYDCGPCMQMMPAVEAAAAHFENKIRFYKVDVNKARDIVMDAQISRVPYVAIYKEGVRIAFFNRALSRTELIEQLNRIMQSISSQPSPVDPDEDEVQESEAQPESF
jgi:thiol-disulfide isomerase/thioredoxin